MNSKKEIAVLIAGILSIKDFPEGKIAGLLEVPPQKELGDLSLPCFRFSGFMKKKPAEIALMLKQKIEVQLKSKKGIGFIERAEVKGPYLNFFYDYSLIARQLVPEVLKKGKNYGRNSEGKAKKVMIEYSAPNTNKPLTLGHLRNDSIGMAVSRLFDVNGWKVIKANLFSDRGVHICKSMYAYGKWGEGRNPNKKPDHFVGDFYVMFNRKLEGQPELEEGVKEMLRKWEKGDKKVRALWKKLNEWVIEGMRQTYKEFGSEFDVEFRESDFYDKARPLIELGLKKKIFEKDEKGNITADLEKEGLGKKVILRADGTSVYISNDLALTKHKFEKFGLDKSIWVVGSEQNLYFRQLFKIFELLGFKWSSDCIHLNYGMVYLPEGRMKSREGKIVDADFLIEEMKKMAKEEILERHPELKGKELDERAKAISLSAIKFFLLKTDALKDMHFDPKQSISFEGETGPYVQYSFARAKSILRKSGKIEGKAGYDLLNSPSEKKLISLILNYPVTVKECSESLAPHSMCQFLLDFTASFNEFYRDCPVIEAESSELRNARLKLVEASSIVLGNALHLLNIGALNEM
ncbi:MAG: arginine--tRNA ligase [Candidatus Diapherotrites archaeon]